MMILTSVSQNGLEEAKKSFNSGVSSFATLKIGSYSALTKGNKSVRFISNEIWCGGNKIGRFVVLKARS